MKSTTIYEDDGSTYIGGRVLDDAGTERIKREAKGRGHTGYLLGYTQNDDGATTTVVFFRDKPPPHEIRKRIESGLLAAEWHNL